MFTREELQVCTRCSLHKTRTHALVGEGNIHADVMLIAQAPGELEDKENRMFIGPSGTILHTLLKNANICEDELYMTNLIKCTLPKNRRPKQKEIEACSFYLDMEIDEVQPWLLAPLGYYATKYLFSRFALKTISRKEFPQLIGNSVRTNGYHILPLSHPASLLYNKEYFSQSLANFHKLKEFMS
ncbi:MAG: uracil-DNA glycosylase [Candidatus Celaenobacter polaris]|nr:uracil-DNA glycosylase [Candidatus Celaenobacter polaris]